MPPEAWGALGLLAGALVTGFVAWWRDRKKPQVDTGTLALDLVRTTSVELARVSARVEVLERDRNAYRSWSHVLWSHIHDERVARLPAPTWPDDLAR